MTVKATIPATGRLFRGAHELPRQAQAIRRDLNGEMILANAGKTTRGYRLDAEQMASGRWHHEYAIYSPISLAFSWVAFDSADALMAFCTAYALHIDRLPEPGQMFDVALPLDESSWQPLEGVA